MPYSPFTGKPITSQTITQIVDQIKTLPKKATIRIGKHLDFSTCLNFEKLKGSKEIHAIPSLRRATSLDSYTSTPRFIRINELPQIKARENIKIQFK